MTNEDLEQVRQMIKDELRINIVATENVPGSMTVKLLMNGIEIDSDNLAIIEYSE